MLNNDHEHASVPKEVMHNRNKGGNNKTCRTDQNYKSKNNHNVKKQQEQRRQNRTGGHRGGGHQTRFTRKGGGGRGNAKNKQVSKTFGCACQDRHHASSTRYLFHPAVWMKGYLLLWSMVMLNSSGPSNRNECAQFINFALKMYESPIHENNSCSYLFSQDFQVTRKRFMTQEFKDQNALVVDGRLLCRHFLWGRCIKASSIYYT